MIEIAIPADRIAGDPVRAEDVEPLFDAGLFDGGPHPRRLGRPEDILLLPWQMRFTLACCDIVAIYNYLIKIRHKRGCGASAHNFQ